MNTFEFSSPNQEKDLRENSHILPQNSRETQLKVGSILKRDIKWKNDGECIDRSDNSLLNNRNSYPMETSEIPQRAQVNDEVIDENNNNFQKSYSITPEKYDHQKSPPDLDLAERHGRAKRIGRENPKKEIKVSDYCICCGYAIDNELLPLTCRRDDLAFTGPGLPLYLEFVFFCIINLLMVFLISGIYNTYIIIKSEACSTLSSEQKKKIVDQREYSCEKSFFLMMSMGNTFHDSDALERQGWSCLATVIFWIIFLHVIRFQLQKLGKKCDDKLTSPSDYTFCLDGFPVGSFSREDIENLVQEMWKDILKRLENWKPSMNLRELQVRKIVFAYSIGKYVKKIRRKNILQGKRRKIIENFHTFKRKMTVNFEKSLTRKSTTIKVKDIRHSHTEQNELKKPKNEEEESENTEDLLYISSPNSPIARLTGMNSEAREPFKKKLEFLDQELLKLITEIKILEEHITEDKSKSLCRMVFVSVGEQIQSNLIVKTYNLSIYKKLETKIRKFFNMSPRSDVCFYKGKIINVRRAPEPNDVLWENLDVTKVRKLKIRFRINLITFVTLMVGFSSILGFRLLQSKLEDVIQDTSSSDITEDQYFQKSFRMMNSILIVFINFILRTLIQYLVNHEKHKTITAYKANVATRIIIGEFSNTALHIIMAQLYLDRFSIWHENNLVTNVFFLFWTNIWVPAIFTCFDPEYYYYKYKRRLILQNRNNSRFSQGDAHKYFEGVPLDLSQKYAQVMQCMFFTAFYASLLPIGTLISTIGLIIMYWVDKYAFLRIHSRPVSLGSHLNFEMLKMLDFTPFLFSIGQLFFSYLLSPKFDISYLYGAGLGLFFSASNIFVPWGTIYEMYWSYKYQIQESASTPSYEESYKGFSNDYDRTNPVTQQKAVNEWIGTIKETYYYNKKKNLKNYLNFVFKEHSSQRKIFQRYAQRKISEKLLVNSNNVFQDTMMKKITATATMFFGSMAAMKTAKAFMKTFKNSHQDKNKSSYDAAMVDHSEGTKKSDILSKGDLGTINDENEGHESERIDRSARIPDSIDGTHRIEKLQAELPSNRVKSKVDLDHQKKNKFLSE